MAREFPIPNMDMTFHWGPVVAAHSIGEYLIVEYHPMIFEHSVGTNRYESKRTEFHPYLKADDKWNDTNRSFCTLDEALAGVIAYKHEGPNCRADVYFIRGLVA